MSLALRRVEGLEDARQVLGWHAVARVGHARVDHPPAVVPVVNARLQDQAAAAGHRVGRVRDQVEEDLSELVTVGGEHGQREIEYRLDLHVPGGELG